MTRTSEIKSPAKKFPYLARWDLEPLPKEGFALCRVIQESEFMQRSYPVAYFTLEEDALIALLIFQTKARWEGPNE